MLFLLPPPLPDLALPAGPGPTSNPLKGYAPYVPGGDDAGVLAAFPGPSQVRR